MGFIQKEVSPPPTPESILFLSLSAFLKYFRDINWETCFILEMIIFPGRKAALNVMSD